MCVFNHVGQSRKRNGVSLVLSLSKDGGFSGKSAKSQNSSGCSVRG